jgi:hypothetical protein
MRTGWSGMKGGSLRGNEKKALHLARPPPYRESENSPTRCYHCRSSSLSSSTMPRALSRTRVTGAAAAAASEWSGSLRAELEVAVVAAVAAARVAPSPCTSCERLWSRSSPRGRSKAGVDS